MKAPKQRVSPIKEKLKHRIVPLRVHKLEYALDGENVNFRFNGNQNVGIPNKVILEIADKIKANENQHNTPITAQG